MIPNPLIFKVNTRLLIAYIAGSKPPNCEPRAYPSPCYSRVSFLIPEIYLNSNNEHFSQNDLTDPDFPLYSSLKRCCLQFLLCVWIPFIWFIFDWEGNRMVNIYRIIWKNHFCFAMIRKAYFISMKSTHSETQIWFALIFSTIFKLLPQLYRFLN